MNLDIFRGILNLIVLLVLIFQILFTFVQWKEAPLTFLKNLCMMVFLSQPSQMMVKYNLYLSSNLVVLIHSDTQQSRTIETVSNKYYHFFC